MWFSAITSGPISLLNRAWCDELPALKSAASFSSKVGDDLGCSFDDQLFHIILVDGNIVRSATCADAGSEFAFLIS